MKKRFIYLCLILAGVCLFMACRQGTSSSSGGVIDPNRPLSLSIAIWEVEPFGNDRIADVIKEKLNLEAIDIIPLDWGTYQTQFQLWASSDSMPDAMGAYPMTTSWFGDFINQEVIKDIPYEMGAKYPNIKYLFDNDGTLQLCRDLYNGIWYLPRPQSRTGRRTGTNQGIYYRKDWANRLGFTEHPTDLEYFYEMIRAFTYNDPDGNGIRDTYGLTGSLDVIYTFHDCFPGSWVNGPGGRVIPGFMDEERMLQALTWLRRAYTECVLDPELTTNNNLVQERFSQGIFGAINRTVGAGWYRIIAVEQWAPLNPGRNYLDDVHIIAGMSPRAGGKRVHMPNFEESGTIFPYNISDEKLDRLLALADYLLTDEGIYMCSMGFEGVDYITNADNSFTMIAEGRTGDRYPSASILTYATWNFDFGQFIDPTQPSGVIEFTSRWQVEANEFSRNANIHALATMLSTPDKRSFIFDHSRYLTEIITGSGDIQTMYRAMLRDAEANGIQRVIDSVNRDIGL